MAERSGTITLQAFLHKYFFKANVDEDEMHRYHVIAADCLRELAIHHLPVAKTTTLTINSTNLTADFPDDFIDYIYIAVERDGRWWTFTRDDKMVDKTITGITGNDLGDIEPIVGPGAVGGHNDYWFKPDYENRRFLFSGVATTADVVILNYQSTGVESVSYASTTDISFPVYAEDVMESYMEWKVSEKDRMALSERQWRKEQYYDSLRMMRNLHNPTIDEIRDIWLASSNVTGVIRSNFGTR